MPASFTDLLPIGLSAVLAVVLTPAVRSLARRRGIVARPKLDRWHKKPTAMLGGLALFASVAITLAFFGPYSRDVWAIMAVSGFLLLLGLLDDLYHLKPYQKLIGQLIGSLVIVWAGLMLAWTPWPLLNMAITVFWLVGITNAINLLDNMDGLAAGIAAIASVCLAGCFYADGQVAEAVLLGSFAAALVGFLLYNSNPASIFMGDCGSMFVGFFLASSNLLNISGGRSRALLPVLVVPVLILLIPILDTTFVTLLRKLSGRPASQGGRDHTSHRLVALGMSERRAVWMLYGLAALSGLLAFLVRELHVDVSLALIGALTVLLTLLGVYLSGVKVYDELEAPRDQSRRAGMAFLVDLSYKRRLFEVLLDVVLIVLSYYAAYAFLFGPLGQNGALHSFMEAIPVLVCMKLAAFLVTGVYRGLWRYVSVGDLVVFAKANVLASLASVLALVLLFRLDGFSRAVFVLDGLFMFLTLAGSRLAFRLFRQMLPARPVEGGRRVLIYGAGDAGELLLRELINNRELGYVPVGFLDDDPLKTGKVIHGLRVLGGNGAMSGLCRRASVAEVILSSRRFSAERIREIRRECEAANIRLKYLRINIEDIGIASGNGESVEGTTDNAHTAPLRPMW